LISNKLAAIRDSEAIPADYWVGKSVREEEDLKGVWFRREDVLKLWPELTGVDDEGGGGRNGPPSSRRFRK
jgi:hypothetical protein